MAEEDVPLEITAAVNAETRLRLEVEAIPHPSSPGGWVQAELTLAGAPIQPAVSSRMGGEREWLFFLGALVVYLIVHLVALDGFPIYFLAAEAVQTVSAEYFVRNGLTNYAGEFLPLYFRPEAAAEPLCVTVYQQVIPYLLFGKSIYVTRAVSALAGSIAAVAVSLSLRHALGRRFWWCGALVLSAVPVWFVNSRTALPPVTAAGMYAAFVYFYLLYRHRAPVYLYPAVVCALLAFYTYAPVQLPLATAGAALLISDRRYHRQKWRTALGGLAVAVMLMIPYLAYRLGGGPAVTALPAADRLAQAAANYAAGLNPLFWYAPQENTGEPVVLGHVMKGLGNLGWPTLPFLLLGLGLLIRDVRLSASRTVLIALFSCPLAGMVAGVGILPLLVMVGPLVLVIVLGVAAAAEWLEWRLAPWLSPPRLALGLSIGLVLVNFSLLYAALTAGPRWFGDYAVLQYGARQIFGAIQSYWQRMPQTPIFLSPNWAEGVGWLARFFLPDEAPLVVRDLSEYGAKEELVPDEALFVLPAGEYRAALATGVLEMQVVQTVDYPDGSIGFYFVNLRYKGAGQPTATEADKGWLQRPVTDTVMLEGQEVEVLHSVYDDGDVSRVFDGDPETLARTWEDNPSMFELTFPQPRTIAGVDIWADSGVDRISLQLYAAAEAGEPETYVFLRPDDGPVYFAPAGAPLRAATTETGMGRQLTVDFEAPRHVVKTRLECFNSLCGGACQVHVFEIAFR